MGASRVVGVLNGEQTDLLRKGQDRLRLIEARAVKHRGSPSELARIYTEQRDTERETFTALQGMIDDE